jgi:hypothetical protein
MKSLAYMSLKTGINGRGGTRCADHVTPLYPQKLGLTSPTSGGRSVGIVRSRTKATEFSSLVLVTSTSDSGMWGGVLGSIEGMSEKYFRSCTK